MTTPGQPDARVEGWLDGTLPANVRLGVGTIVRGAQAFRRFRSAGDPGLEIGDRCMMDGVHFALGPQARVLIGADCCFTSAILLCERELRIGRGVMIGWNATIADSDFHPLDPAQRIADAIACSPLGAGRARPAIDAQPVVIEDGVWIGPNAVILKGVSIGSGSFIEPGSVVTRDIPPRSRVLGNPARVTSTL